MKYLAAFTFIFFASSVFAGDNVVFATGEDLAAFDRLVRKSQKKSKKSNRKNITNETKDLIQLENSQIEKAKSSKRQNEVKRINIMGPGGSDGSKAGNPSKGGKAKGKK